MSDCNNDVVIISTRERIDAVDWREYLLKHWHRLFQDRGSKLLVLGGIHGNDTSKLKEINTGLGRKDEDYLEDCQEQLKIIRSEK